MTDDHQSLAFRRAVADRIRHAREAEGYETQDDIARALGLQRDTYSKYEKPTKPVAMPQDVLVRFAAICRVDIDWILTGKGHGPFGRPTRRRGESA